MCWDIFDVSIKRHLQRHWYYKHFPATHRLPKNINLNYVSAKKLFFLLKTLLILTICIYLYLYSIISSASSFGLGCRCPIAPTLATLLCRWVYHLGSISPNHICQAKICWQWEKNANQFNQIKLLSRLKI